MATYFHGNSDIQAATPDGLQTLVLMNPTGYIPYSDTPPPAPPHSSASAGNLIFLNSAAASLAHHQHHHHHHAPPPPQQHTFVGSAKGAADVSALHHAFLPQRVHYNLWAPPPDASPAARDTPRASAASAAAQQGLSLTLSSQQLGFGSPPGGQSHAPPPPTSGESASSVSVVTNGVPGIQSVLLSSKYLKAAQELLEEVVNVGGELPKKGGGGGGSSKAVGESSGAAASGEGSGAVGSGGGGEGGSGKRAAELTPAERQDVQMKKAKLISMLEEVEQRYRQYHHQMQIVISSFEQVAGMGSARTYTALALQTISKQFRCLKDAIAGQIRAANKSLGEEDCLGGGGGGGGGKMEGSRLKFVDHHLRQQRALQQLGMIQQNAWRPQRGLPERSVSVLRAWLFEHFLHPYPKDSDKHMLAKQTGLTRSQVSNWFINARVRLWKPMVEEMYLEEIKEQEQNGGSGGEKPSKSSNNNDESDSKSKEKSPGSNTNTNTNTDNQTASFTPKQDHHHHHHHHALANSSTAALPQQQQYMPSGITLSSPARNHSSVGGFSLIGPSELDGITQSSPKKARCDNDHDNNNSNNINMLNSPSHNSHVHSMGMDVKPGSKMGNESHNNVSMKFVDSTESRQGRDGYAFMGGQANFISGFGQYPIAEIEQFTPRFSGNNGVSLTLGLPHCDNHHLSLAGAHQSFVPNQTIQLGRRVDHHHHGIGEASHEFMGAMNTSPHPHSSSAAAAAAAFDSINIPNPKRFAAQLLPDFVS